VDHVRSQLPVSERRVCSVVGQPRATQRRKPKIRDDEAALTEVIVRLAKKYGRYGYRRVRQLLVDDGWRVSVKRVYRIWRRAESTKEATQTRPSVAQRRIMYPSQT
jgi:putative transposase